MIKIIEKPIPKGIKNFVLADSSTAFILNVVPYVAQSFSRSGQNDLKKTGGLLVYAMMSGENSQFAPNFLHQGRELYTDRFFVSRGTCTYLCDLYIVLSYLDTYKNYGSSV